MKITKIGHCALILEHDGTKFLTDPGNFTIEGQEKVTGLDAIVITHEHQDHFHVDSIKVLLKTNPNVAIVSNSAVGKLLEAQGIKSIVAGDGQSATVKGIKIEGFGRDHAPIYGTMGLVENTGYFIADKFYFPGDNFHVPGKPVDVLALPVAGPWMKISEAVDFAKKINARTAFGVHDGMIQPSFRGFTGMLLKMFVPKTEYVALQDGESREF
ncbi:MAG TPA: MBL fold metallo-hydrolase [Candidatus Paceibacterota bacterium]|jgi:L-ascorbate metabolism protein UlaG (beta-lactamase superfamily)|nr:MBL fold metallo-hydrolase [Candidatus Paceibacterota bacterium]